MKVSGNPSKGVGGFLALLVAGLMVFGPLLSVLMAFGEMRRTEETFPHIVGTSAWSSFNTIAWTSLSVQVALTFSAGLMLSNIFRPSSVRFTIFVLWFSGIGLTLISMAFVASIPGIDGGALAGEIAKGLVQGTIVAGVWTAYLLLSKRVKATYYASPELEAGSMAAMAKRRLSMAERWRGLSLTSRKAVFFSGCWIALVFIWATVFDEDTTYLFQDSWDLEWGKIWTWALLPPAVYFVLRWAYDKFVIAGSDKDPA